LGKGGYGVEMEPRIDIGLATSVGQVRTGNEDSVLCEPLESALVAERGLFCAVADGMGGHAAGEVASSMAVSTARDRFYGASGGDIGEALRSAISEANTAVYDAGAGTTGRDHMGSTLTAAVLSNREVIVGHVGDTRCYIVRRGAISQLTRDHSWVAEEVAAGLLTEEQARVHPRRNIITRALGLRPDVEVDIYHADLDVGNLIVICSDGLHGLVTDDEILTHVTRYRPSVAVDALVKLANERGGPDNISVLVAQVIEDEADTQPGFFAMADTPTPHSTPAPGMSILDPEYEPSATTEPEETVADLPTTPTSVPKLAETPPEALDEPTTAPAAIPLSPELGMDEDDDTHPATIWGLRRPDELSAPSLSQSQTQGQDTDDHDTPPPMPLPTEVEIGPSTERRPVLDYLPTARPAATPDEGVAEPEPEPASAAVPAETRAVAERQTEPPRRSGRASGMGLVVVLILLLVLGAGIGFLLFRLFGLGG
jgi:PPM family protein phosphatase